MVCCRLRDVRLCGTSVLLSPAPSYSWLFSSLVVPAVLFGSHAWAWYLGSFTPSEHSNYGLCRSLIATCEIRASCF